MADPRRKGHRGLEMYTVVCKSDKGLGVLTWRKGHRGLEMYTVVCKSAKGTGSANTEKGA